MKVQDQAKREPRSFKRLITELTALGGMIGDLWKHVRAACHIVGIPEPDGLVPRPREEPGPRSPMIWVLDEVADFQDWVRRINRELEKPLKELVPEFYERMEVEKAAKEKEKN